MKILFVISTLDTGGAQRVLSNLLLSLPSDWEFEILLNDSESIKYPYRGKIIDLGLKKQLNKMSLFYQAKVAFKRIKKLKKLKKSEKYDLCFSFMESANFANLLTGNKYCKTVLSVHNCLSMECKKSKKYRHIVAPLVKRLYNKADKIVSVSKMAALDLAENFGIKEELITTIYNGIDYSDIRSKIRQKPPVNLDDKAFKYVTMGRLSKQKGHWHLIKAFARVVEQFPYSKLYILGEGELKEQLEELLEGLNITDKVEFLGFLDNPFSVISKCQSFVFPSLHEGFSCALVEAMACNIPIIATDCYTGNREILAPATDIRHKNDGQLEEAEYGILVPAPSFDVDVDATRELDKEEIILFEAMLKIQEKEELREKYARLSLKRAEEISIGQMAVEYETLFLNIRE